MEELVSLAVQSRSSHWPGRICLKSSSVSVAYSMRVIPDMADIFGVWASAGHSGVWSTDLAMEHSTVREILAVGKALESFASKLAGLSVK